MPAGTASTCGWSATRPPRSSPRLACSLWPASISFKIVMVCLGAGPGRLGPGPGRRLQQHRLLAADLAEQVGAARLVERGAQLRELDLLLLARMRRDHVMQGAQILHPARVVLWLVLELEQLDLHLGMVAI